MIRIAIVDDEQTVLEYLLSKLLSISNDLSIDCKIETFLNGSDLLQRNRENPFHLIFLDLEMPELDGLSTAKNTSV